MAQTGEIKKELQRVIDRNQNEDFLRWLLAKALQYERYKPAEKK